MYTLWWTLYLLADKINIYDKDIDKSITFVFKYRLINFDKVVKSFLLVAVLPIKPCKKY